MEETERTRSAVTAPVGRTCIRCGAPRAPGKRNPSRFCATSNGRCRKAFHRLHKRFVRRYQHRHPDSVPSPSFTAAVATAAALGVRGQAPLEDLVDAIASWGVELSMAELVSLTDELVVDGLITKTVTPSGPMFSRVLTDPKLRAAVRNLLKAKRPSPKRGAQTGVQCGGTVTARRQNVRAALAPRAPQVQGRGRQAGAPITVKMIAPPTVDGGTAFTIKVAASLWREELQALLALARDGNWKTMPQTVTIPSASGREFTAIVRLGKRGNVELQFGEAAQLNLYDRGGFATLITKAGALWADGLDAWMRTWFDLASWLLMGARCQSPEEAAALGWRTRNLELCADFTGLRFYDVDVRCFVGAKGRPKRIDSHGFKPDGSVETLESTKRSRSALSVGTHDKTQKLLSVDKISAENSVYAPTWRAHGWDGQAEVRRVEVRAPGACLHLTTKAHDLDLREPAALLDPSLLGRLWGHATSRFRLVVPPSRGTEMRCRPVDPRWAAVQKAGGAAPLHRYTVDRSEARRLDLATKRERADRKVLHVLASAAGLEASDDIVGAIRDVIERARNHPSFEGLVAAARESRDRYVDP